MAKWGQTPTTLLVSWVSIVFIHIDYALIEACYLFVIVLFKMWSVLRKLVNFSDWSMMLKGVMLFTGLLVMKPRFVILNSFYFDYVMYLSQLFICSVVNKYLFQFVYFVIQMNNQLYCITNYRTKLFYLYWILHVFKVV